MATVGEGLLGADTAKLVLPAAVDCASFKVTDVPLDSRSAVTASASDMIIISTHYSMNE